MTKEIKKITYEKKYYNHCCDNEFLEYHEPEKCRIKYHLDRYANAVRYSEYIQDIKKDEIIDLRFELLNLPPSPTISKVKILSQSDFMLTIKNEKIQVIEDWVVVQKPKNWYQQPEINVKFRFLENRPRVYKGYLSNLFVSRCFLRILDDAPSLPKNDFSTFDMPKPNLLEIGHIFPSDDDESQDDENDKIFSNLEPMNSEPEPSPNLSKTLENSTEVEETSKLKNPKRLLLKLKRNSLAKGRVEWQKAVEKKNMEDQDDAGDISLMEEEPSLETSNYEQQKAVKFWFGQVRDFVLNSYTYFENPVILYFIEAYVTRNVKFTQ